LLSGGNLKQMETARRRETLVGELEERGNENLQSTPMEIRSQE
jgi:hypothetical protein